MEGRAESLFGVPRTSRPGLQTFCSTVIGAFDPITGDLAHSLLVAMFPEAIDITELSASEMQEWTKLLPYPR